MQNMFNLGQLKANGSVMLVQDYFSKYRLNIFEEDMNGDWDLKRYSSPALSTFSIDNDEFWPYHSIMVDTVLPSNAQNLTDNPLLASTLSALDFKPFLITSIVRRYFEEFNWKQGGPKQSSFIMPLSKVFQALPQRIQHQLESDSKLESGSGLVDFDTRIHLRDSDQRIALLRQWLVALCDRGEQDWMLVSSYALQ